MELIERAQPQLVEATALAVLTVPARQRAADLWDAIRAFRKQAESQKEETCRPLKTAWDDAKQPFDAFIKECQGHETALGKKISDWDHEQQRLADLEQAKIQARIDAQNAKASEKAEAKGVEPVLRVAPIVQAPPKSVKTQAGTTQTRIMKKVYWLKGIADTDDVKANDARVKDLLAHFPALFVLDWPAFRKLASTGMLDGHPNVETREEYIYAQR